MFLQKSNFFNDFYNLYIIQSSIDHLHSTVRMYYIHNTYTLHNLKLIKYQCTFLSHLCEIYYQRNERVGCAIPLTQIDSIDFIASILLQMHLAVFKIEQQL